MAISSKFQFLLLFSSVFFILSSQALLLLPITKDSVTLQYLTKLHVGTRQFPVNLALDLTGSYLWLDCSSGYLPNYPLTITSCSIQCSLAKTLEGKKVNSHCDAKRSELCDVMSVNSFTGVESKGVVVEDFVAVRSVDLLGKKPIVAVDDRVLFSCVSPGDGLLGLSSGVKGMLGLGRSSIALPWQIAKSDSFKRKFTLCLSSKNGPGGLFLGQEVSISKSLTYTPLVLTKSSKEYFINLKSIRINGKTLSIATTDAKLSTTVAYTTMESFIYQTFTKAYLQAAVSMNMTRVSSVSPFEFCFSSKHLVAPSVDLVLQSEMVKLGFTIGNLMVPVGDDVMCLGFLDGGLTPSSNIVIGGFQLEDFVLEFDLSTSMLGFSSLSRKGTSCSEVVSSSGSTRKESL
ncbi:hypothetical protein ACFE04_014251 [Oxalis oulophora]